MCRCILSPAVKHVVVVLFFLAVILNNSEGREFRLRRAKSVAGNVARGTAVAAVMVPDTASINNDELKTLDADKFLSLWFIFVLGGPTQKTEKPWTIFIPSNNGLPGPGMHGFLTSRVETKSILLNHVVIGQSIDLSNLPTGEVVTSEGTALKFTQNNGGMFVNGVKITGKQMNAEGGSIIIVEKFIPVDKSEDRQATTVHETGEKSIASDQVRTRVVDSTRAQATRSPRRRSRFRTTTSEKPITLPRATTTTTEKIVQLDQSEITSEQKRKVRPSPLFRSFRSKRVDEGQDAKPAFHQRSQPILIQKPNAQPEKEKTTTEEKNKTKIQETTEPTKQQKPKQTLRQRTKQTLRQRTKQRLLQRAKQAKETLQQRKIANKNNNEPNEHINEPSLQERKRNKNINEQKENTEKMVQNAPPPVAATRFEKFKNRVKLAKEREAKQKLIEASSLLEKLSTTHTNKMSATTSVPEITTEVNVVTESVDEMTELPVYVTESDINTEITSEVAETVTETGITSEAEVTETNMETSSTAEKVAEFTTEDSTSNIFALFAAGLSTKTSITTTEKIEAKVDEKEADILAAFQQFVQSTQSKETTPVKIFFETTTETPEEHFEFPLSEFISGDKPMSEIKRAGEMKLSEIVADGPEIHSLSNNFQNDDSGFLGWMKSEIKERKQLGGKEFLNHLIESGVAKQLLPEKKYTAFIPTDEAFYEHYPIDWGFNIFSVKSFLIRTLQEHLIAADMPLEILPNGALITTLAGTTLTVTNNGGDIAVSGIKVLKESESTSKFGRIYSLPKVLHVTQETTDHLRDMNPHLERAPLLGSPWPMSQFLSHLYQRTSEKKSTSLFAKYLSMSHISHLTPYSDEDMNHLEYTALVPNNESITQALARMMNSTSDNNLDSDKDLLLQDVDLRNKFVGSHILKGRYGITDLMPGVTVTTLLNGTLEVTALEDGSISIGGSKLTSTGSSIYNLGAMFTVKEPLVLGDNNQKKDNIEMTTEAPLVVTRTEVSVSRHISTRGALSSLLSLP